MSTNPTIDGSGDRLDYIQAMLGQLRTMAQAEGHDMLAYLIEMACLEGADIMRGKRPARLQAEVDKPSAAKASRQSR